VILHVRLFNDFLAPFLYVASRVEEAKGAGLSSVPVKDTVLRKEAAVTIAHTYDLHGCYTSRSNAIFVGLVQPNT
jgi:hypothetical protein